MATSPASGPGGGGASFPSQWTIGPHGELTIAADDPAGAHNVLTLSTPPASGAYLINARADDLASALVVAPDGTFRFHSGDGDVLARFTNDDNTEQLRISGADDSVNTVGFYIFGRTSAPADASLVAGRCALWLDDTNGASKLMVKAKSADGTVVTAAVALA